MPLPFPLKSILNLGVGREGLVGYGVESQSFTATLAEIIATKILLPKIPGFRYQIVGFLFRFAGTAATATDIRLSTTEGTPVDVVTIPVAQAANGAKRDPADANVTLGAGFDAELAEGHGVLIRETGTDLTGTTSVTVTIFYRLLR